MDFVKCIINLGLNKLVKLLVIIIKLITYCITVFG